MGKSPVARATCRSERRGLGQDTRLPRACVRAIVDAHAPSKARATSFEPCDRAYPGAPGFPRWTKPITRAVGTIPRIDAAITLEDQYVTVPMDIVVTLGDREFARSEPVELIGLGRKTHDLRTRFT